MSTSDYFGQQLRIPLAFHSKISIQISEVQASKMKPQYTRELIARPEICLVDPFEQINLKSKEEAFMSLYQDDSGECLPFSLWNNGSLQFGSL